MRRMGRTFESRAQNRIDEHRVVAEAGWIKWHIYDGPVGDDENAPGWISSLWAATCIPYSLYQTLEDIPKDRRIELVRDNIKLLRVNNTLVKFLPTPETHLIKAPPPDARPTEGILEEMPVPQRQSKGSVKKGVSETKPATTMAEKVRNVKSQLKGKSLQEILYPQQGDMWFGNIRQGKSEVEVYTETDSNPLLSIQRDALSVNTEQTHFAHDPNAMKYRTKEGNPLIEVLPSTSGVPVDTYIPYVGEIVAIISIVKAIADFFKKYGDTSYTDFVSRTDTITEVVDYQTMRRWYSYEEGT